MMARFEYMDMDTGEMRDTDDPIEFWMAVRREANGRMQRWADRRRSAMADRLAIGQLKTVRSMIEGEALLDPRIDGKTAEIRKAQAEQFAVEHEEWRTTEETLRALEESHGLAEVEADVHIAAYRVALRDLEVLAAIYGPARTETA